LSAGFVGLTQLSGNATPAAHLEAVGHCPRTNLGGVSGAGGFGDTSSAATRCAGSGATSYGLITLENATELFRVSGGEVNLVLATIETETDTLVSGAALEVVNKFNNSSGSHGPIVHH
jgi:hypothetical protein